MYSAKVPLGQTIFSQKNTDKMFKASHEIYFAFTGPFAFIHRVTEHGTHNGSTSYILEYRRLLILPLLPYRHGCAPGADLDGEKRLSGPTLCLQLCGRSRTQVARPPPPRGASHARRASSPSVADVCPGCLHARCPPLQVHEGGRRDVPGIELCAHGHVPHRRQRTSASCS